MSAILIPFKKYRIKKASVFMSISFGLLFLSLFPNIFSTSVWYSAVSIVCVNLYLLTVLFCAASKSDIELEEGSGWEKFTSAVIPEKRLGLAIYSKLLGTLIFGFANLYVGLHDGVRAGNLPLRSFYDGVYFSVVTISTAGYGDFAPVSVQAKALVMWELGSGILLLAGGFGLLISRLANFK